MQFSLIRTIKDLYFSNFPPYVVFFVTSKCNSKCKMCFYWREIEESAKEDELTLEEIRKISEKMPKFYSLAISGGEPFLRNDLWEICGNFIVNNKIRHLSIPTNGLLHETIIDQVKKICSIASQTKVEIEFSIDGPPEIHDEIRGVKNNFKIAIGTLEEIKKLEEIYPNLTTKVNTTFSKYNQNYICELIDFLKDELKLNRTNVSLLHGDARLKESEEYDINLYKKTVDYLIKKQIASKSLAFLDSLLISIKHLARQLLIQVVEQKKYPIRCKALKKFIVIRETGNIYPCEPIDKPVGSLRKNSHSILTLLNSAGAKKYRENFDIKNCYCTWGCSILNNILYSPRHLLKIILIYIKYKF